MTVREVTSRVRGTLKEFYSDSVLTNRLIWNIIQSGLMLYLDRDGKNIYKLDIFTKVTLEQEDYNIYEGTCVPLECQGCRYKLPKGAENKNGLIYRYIGSPDQSITYKVVSPSAFQNKKKLRGDKGKYMILEEGYLYTSDCLPCLTASILLDSPISEEGENCSVLDTEAQIPPFLLDILIKMNLQELQIHKQLPYQEIQNKSDNT